MKKGKLYTSCFAKLNKGIGLKISIARYNPKWLKEEYINDWFNNLAPSKELLNEYKYKGLSWETYTKRYMNELDMESDQFKTLLNLLNIGKDVTVYCYEKSTDNCHRHILASIIKEMGYEIEEI